MQNKEMTIALNNLRERIIDLSVKVDELTTLQTQLLAKKYLNNNAASQILKVSQGTLYKMRKEGVLKFTRIRGHIIYKASDIQFYVEKRFGK